MAETAETRRSPGDGGELRKSIGFWQLTAISFSGVIGSG